MTEEQLSSLPGLQPLTYRRAEPEDIFVCALGFEDRCLSAPERLVEMGYRARHALCLRYNPEYEENLRNLKPLSQHLRRITDKSPATCSYDWAGPLVSRRALEGAWNDLFGLEKVQSATLDTSSLTTMGIVQTLDFLCVRVETLRVLYTEYESRHPLERSEPVEAEEEAGTSGVRTILTVPGFGGLFSPGYSPLLVVFLTFESARLRGIFRRFQPASRTGIVGIPRSQPFKWWATRLREKFSRRVEQIVKVSSFDYRDVLTLLETIYGSESPTHNITVAPTGSKMQTIGTFLHGKRHPDVQLLFAIPISWDPERYSKGCGETWQVTFQSDDLQSLFFETHTYRENNGRQ